MTRQLSRWQAVQIGLVVLVGLALGSWILLKVKDRHDLGSDAFHVESGLADIAGVDIGSRVRLQGIDAGEVVAVIPPTVPGETVKLRMRLTGKLRHLVTADAKVQIGSDSMFSGRIVRVLPGTAQAGPVPDGATLAAAQTPELTETLAKTASAASGVLDDLAKGKGTLGKLIQEDTLHAKLNDVLSKLDTVIYDVEKGKGSLGKLLTDDALYTDLAGTLSELKQAVRAVRQGEGTLGKLVKNNEAYTEAVQSLQDVRRMVASVKQNADAIKALPVVRSYVVDAHKELVRPECQKHSQWFKEGDLFEPGRAVLTAAGRKQLDGLSAWIKEHKEAGSEVVIASFANPGENADLAQTVTQKQSDAVTEYLKTSRQIHRTGWWWWSTRTVRSVGVGVNHPAIPGNDKLPPARIEVAVFVPAAK